MMVYAWRMVFGARVARGYGAPKSVGFRTFDHQNLAMQAPYSLHHQRHPIVYITFLGILTKHLVYTSIRINHIEECPEALCNI